MQVPLQIVFKRIGHSDAIEARVHEEVRKLEKFHDRITAARAFPAAPILWWTSTPSLEHAHEDVYVAVHDASKAARRQLQDAQRERQSSHKARAD